MSEANRQQDSAAADPAAGLAVRSLIVPLSGMALILPNTAVAEVADYRAPEPIKSAPAWLLGMMQWRGRSVPLLAFEQMVGASAGAGGVHARAIVCNTLNGNMTLPFIALMAQGIPRLTEVKAEVLEPTEGDEQEQEAVAAWVRFSGLEAVIPDLDAIERMLVRQGIKVG